MKSSRHVIFLAFAAAVLLSPLILKGTDKKFAFSGVEELRELPKITPDSLLSGEAQSDLEAYLQQNLPGKPLMVRLRNQMIFSLLHTVPNNNYSMNDHRNLFTWGNVSYYYQYIEPMQEEDMKIMIGKIERLKELLEASGRQLFLFITPCKVRFEEAEVPWVDRVMAPEQKEGNYDLLIRCLQDSELDYFNSIDYIREHQQEFDSRVPLFYRTNVHWSTYVGNLVGAAFGEYLEEKSGYNLPEISVTAEPCTEPVYPDSDACAVFNLLQKPYDRYYAPVIEITDAETDAPGILCRGGSFMGQSLAAIIRSHYFGKDVYMENIQLFTEEFSQVTQFRSYDDVDMREYFKDTDLVILEVNEPSIPNMSFGLIDYVLEHPEIL